MNIVEKIKIDTGAEKLYAALATQEGMEGWWCKDCDIATEVGEKSNMRFIKEGNLVKMQFRMDTLKANEVVSWTCSDNANPAWIGTTLTFQLKKMDDGAGVLFTHANWDEKWNDQPPYTQTRDTWGLFMQSLKSYCETGVGQPW